MQFDGVTSISPISGFLLKLYVLKASIFRTQKTLQPSLESVSNDSTMDFKQSSLK